MTHPYDPNTIERLKARHGPERAGWILAGPDRQTNADIDVWNRLGRGPEPHDPLADPLTPELRAKVETVFRRVT